MKPTHAVLSIFVSLSCSSGKSGDADGEKPNEGGESGTASEVGGRENTATGGKKSANGGTDGSVTGTGGKPSAGGSSGGVSGGSGGVALTGGTPGAAGKPGGFLTEGIAGPIPVAPGCLKFKATVFDFVSSHSDFQFPPGTEGIAQIGFVESTLGGDGNPVLASEFSRGNVTSVASFREWFVNTPAANKVVDVEFTATKRSNVLYAFGGDDNGWYPIDGKGHGNVDIVAPDTATADVKTLDAMHNQLFTAKIEAQFYYQGGKNETLISESDDDSWVFINGKLAIDNGGLHGFIPSSVKLDEVAATLGLKPGLHYPITLFYAERQFGAAKYRVTHNLLFSHCK